MNTPIVQSPLGLIDSETFYSERDSRTGQVGASRGEHHSIAIVIPREAGDPHSLLMASLWIASLARRMGRAFSHTIVVSDGEWSESPATAEQTPESPAQTVRQLLEAEMMRADPFGPMEWRDLAEGALQDTSIAIWLGPHVDLGPPPSVASILLGANGWTVQVECCGSGTVPAQNSGDSFFHAAPAAIVTAASLALAAVFRITSGLVGTFSPLWLAMDSGFVAEDPETGNEWMNRGASRATPVPWQSQDQNDWPGLDNLLLVSAGGLGLNVAHVLAASSLRLKNVAVVDPDVIELSNLNRLFGVGLPDLGAEKATLGARVFRARGVPAVAIQTDYEQWRETEAHLPFLSGGGALILGVDQVQTRLEVASDWPDLLLNGATSGLRWVVSAHRPGLEGCLGCFYGSSRLPYNNLANVVACGGRGGGVDVAVRTPVPMASYPHVSASAAASMAALLIHAVWDRQNGDPRTTAGQRRELSTLAPELARVQVQRTVPSCRLLCGTEDVSQLLQVRAQRVPTESNA